MCSSAEAVHNSEANACLPHVVLQTMSSVGTCASECAPHCHCGTTKRWARSRLAGWATQEGNQVQQKAAGGGHSEPKKRSMKASSSERQKQKMHQLLPSVCSPPLQPFGTCAPHSGVRSAPSMCHLLTPGTVQLELPLAQLEVEGKDHQGTQTSPRWGPPT